jgi:predicted ATPase
VAPIEWSGRVRHATHFAEKIGHCAPILLAYAEAQVLSFSSGRVTEVGYKEIEGYQIASGFLSHPEA